MDSIAGFILVGGESRRMGTDKSGLTLNGRSFVDRIASQISGVSSSVTIVGGNAAVQLKPSGNPAIAPDVYPHWGALGGVHAALTACAAQCSAEWALIVACDFPFVTSELFVRLASVREGFEAVAPVQSDSIPQPLCSLYRVEPCLVRAEEFDNINTPQDYARIAPERS